MTCRNIPLSLLAANPNLAEFEAAALHLSGCADCRERLRIMTALKAVFKEQQEDQVEPPARTRRSARRSLKLLAAALLLAFLLPLSQGPRPVGPLDGVDVATSEAYPAFPLRTRSDLADARIEEALAAYRAGRYEQAADLFSRFAQDAQARFYEGVSCYFLNRTERALESLEAAAQLDSAWREPALWYQANALLKAGRIEEARQLLTRLSSPAGAFSPAAKRLLGRLDKEHPIDR